MHSSKSSSNNLFGMHQKASVATRSQKYLLRHFNKTTKTVALTTVAGALIGLSISEFQHPRWLAKMTIQIGQVTMPAETGRLIETQLSATDRYNLPSFRLLVLQDMGLPTDVDNDPEAKVVFDSLRASPAKGSDLVDVEVSDYSRERAQAVLIASFNEFSREHQKEFESSVNDMKIELDRASAKLIAVKADSDRTYKTLEIRNVSGNISGNSSDDIVLTGTARLINKQIVALTEQTSQLRDAIDPLHTYPTRILVAPYAPQRPTTLGRTLLIAIGAALGLLLGASISAFRRTRRA
jgi:uncharacterized protein involved in exopolysaccharide biosynthesis